MKKSILALGLAGACMFSLTSVPNAQATEVTSQEAAHAEDNELSTGAAAAITIAAILAVVGLGAGATVWAVQQRLIPNPLPGVIPGPRPRAKAPAQKPAPRQNTAPANAPRQAPKPAPAPRSVPKPAPAPAPQARPAPANQNGKRPANGYYRNCAAAREAGVNPIYDYEPGYRSALDRDGDGVACE
ncbi:hypothetical protein CKJ81_01470 [Corynebacterium hadale]|uniref:Excalibur calcium-binding domain-containing protein n=3 Tax=Corynebacteriaceae TaxID=1653 RepID=A0ABX4HCP1_9CORY|nr:hypothetical protein CKJ85_07245 [Corynebacterium sp. NML 150383]PAT07275.1 hypothetical protein CKJ81_01470 [Corynebacterium hadale]RMD19791.1 hypothetical protein EAW56_05315 [Corynebacterium gottingense]